ncbi:DUF4116 domain-containing protein [Dysgonomonas sp. GY75]|uniref:DUF4116 domain-containing protein n=1 Tax=Dysgonomonas sp. GY75 TaxID=2780419 RepID=UPI0018841C17|nr:DUF4116 domain-containing protein [Dysgonomonas sp. GY75]MBF0647443.1 DUF4116 domain-containing protein [Dysgonomonas sp. GY75]
MEHKNKDTAYFLMLNRGDIQSPFRLFRRLGIKPVFDENEYFDKLKQEGTGRVKLLVYNKKAWAWTGLSGNKPESLKDIPPDEILKILGLPPEDKIPSYELDRSIQFKYPDYYWLETDKDMPRPEFANQCYSLGLIYKDELEGLANYPWPVNKLLVVEHKIYGPENITGKEAMKELEIDPGKSIQTFKLTDLVKQHERDIRLVEEDFRMTGHFSGLPTHRKTEAVILAAIKADYNNIGYVPVSAINQRIAETMASIDGKSLEIIPNELITKEICMSAVSNDGMALEFVPEKFHSEELFERAIENECWALRFVPEDKKTEALCYPAARQAMDLEYEGFRIARYIPYPAICLDILKEAAQTYDVRSILSTSRKETIDREIALEAVKRDINCLGLIPQEVRTPDFYKQALKADGRMLQYIPGEMKTPEACLEAVCKDPALAVHVPASVSAGSDMNIYRFAMAVKKQEPQLALAQIRELYGGRNVEIDYTVAGTSIPRKVHLRHNRISNSLEYCDIPKILPGKRLEAGVQNKGGKQKV